MEIDESAYGGKPRLKDYRATAPERTRRAHQKPTIFAMVERGGRVKAKIVPNRTGPLLIGTAREYVLPSSMIFTDEFPLYRGIHKHFAGHKRIKHRAKIYVQGDTHTQTVEGFFGLFKNGVRGVYHSVSHKYLQSYLDEYAFRYNARKLATPMFWLILDRVQKEGLAAA